MLSRREVEQAIRGLLGKYHADYAILFGSYARESANANSDVTCSSLEKSTSCSAVGFPPRSSFLEPP